MTTLVYDGSFTGFLTAIFEVYERRLDVLKIVPGQYQIPDAFSKEIAILSEPAKAERVWTGLQERLSKEACERIWYAFLSDLQNIEQELLQMMRYVFASDKNVEEDFSHAAILAVTQTARKVWREKHRMEAFVRFQQLTDGSFYAGIEPAHNVLPLILPHFKSRYADQDWLIYDIKRKYGILYKKLNGIAKEVSTSDGSDRTLAKNDAIIRIDDIEPFYQELWKDYFKHTGIPERKNLKLHLQHIPRKYWKHLTEKHL